MGIGVGNCSHRRRYYVSGEPLDALAKSLDLSTINQMERGHFQSNLSSDLSTVVFTPIKRFAL